MNNATTYKANAAPGRGHCCSIGNLDYPPEGDGPKGSTYLIGRNVASDAIQEGRVSLG